MKKLSNFNQSKLEKLQDYKISNLVSVVGGWKCASTWSGGGCSGTDEVTDDTHDTTFEGTGGDNHCYYWDICFDRAMQPGGGGRDVKHDKGLSYIADDK